MFDIINGKVMICALIGSTYKGLHSDSLGWQPVVGLPDGTAFYTRRAQLLSRLGQLKKAKPYCQEFRIHRDCAAKYS